MLCFPGRTTLLILLNTAFGGAWTLEQPKGSVLEYYPRWRRMMQAVWDHGGPFAASDSVIANWFLSWVYCV